MRIATWNVNSVRARLPRITPWIEQHQPDVLCLQETKVVDEQFPHEPFEDLGYVVQTFGQKSYNGVAIAANREFEVLQRGFPGDSEDEQKRLIAGQVDDFLVVNIYLPNGSEVGSEKFAYKMEWMKKLRSFLDEFSPSDEKLVLTGDFNITFDDRDVYDPDGWREKIHCSTPEREALAHVMEYGLHDALRKHDENEAVYTWWDMRGGAWPKNNGLRIDHFLVTESALETCTAVEVHRDERGLKSPSDHVPVVAVFD